jgi:hypothetical protein
LCTLRAGVYDSYTIRKLSVSLYVHAPLLLGVRRFRVRGLSGSRRGSSRPIVGME